MGTKNEYLILHYENMYRKKSDIELSMIVSSTASQIGLMDAAGTSVAQAEELFAKMEAANRITSQREAKRQAVVNAKREYDNTLEARKKKAILNLRTAASYNGQLIIAILEDEDGKSKDDFFDWEELSELGEDGIKKILSELCKEGMIELRDDGKYYLLEILNTSLIPHDIVKWGLRKAFHICPENISDLPFAQKDVALILETFPTYKAMSTSDYMKEIEFYLDFPEWKGYNDFSEFDLSRFKRNESMLNARLRELVRKGIMKEFGNGSVYALALLGEEG